MRKLIVCVVMFAVFLTACSSVSAQSEIATPIMITAEVSTAMPDGGGTVSTPEFPTPLPTLASAFSPTELKYKVLGEFPDFFFCDPDFYPIAREDESAL